MENMEMDGVYVNYWIAQYTKNMVYYVRSFYRQAKCKDLFMNSSLVPDGRGDIDAADIYDIKGQQRN